MGWMIGKRDESSNFYASIISFSFSTIILNFISYCLNLNYFLQVNKRPNDHPYGVLFS